jgi:hypothetical protein
MVTINENSRTAMVRPSDQVTLVAMHIAKLYIKTLAKSWQPKLWKEPRIRDLTF